MRYCKRRHVAWGVPFLDQDFAKARRVIDTRANSSKSESEGILLEAES
jgi:hypothetical protein